MSEEAAQPHDACRVSAAAGPEDCRAGGRGAAQWVPRHARPAMPDARRGVSDGACPKRLPAPARQAWGPSLRPTAPPLARPVKIVAAPPCRRSMPTIDEVCLMGHVRRDFPRLRARHGAARCVFVGSVLPKGPVIRYMSRRPGCTILRPRPHLHQLGVDRRVRPRVRGLLPAVAHDVSSDMTHRTLVHPCGPAAAAHAARAAARLLRRSRGRPSVVGDKFFMTCPFRHAPSSLPPRARPRPSQRQMQV